MGRLKRFIDWITEDVWECEYCGCSFKDEESALEHERYCFSNPDGIKNLRGRIIKLRFKNVGDNDRCEGD